MRTWLGEFWGRCSKTIVALAYLIISRAIADLTVWREKHLRSDEENIRFCIRQCLEIKPDTEEALNLLFQLDRLLKIRESIIFTTVVISTGSLLGIILSLPPNLY